MTMSPSRVSASESTNAPLQLDGCHVHFVGIGGCGMSGLARIAKAAGAVCSGSDHATSAVVEGLRAEGIDVTLEQNAGAVPANCELLVHSAAIKPEHPERMEAERRGVAVLKYAQMLGRLMVGRTGVAIAGTHGKSTTTSLLAHVLLRGETDPSFIVGATCEQIGGGARSGGSDVLIAEACEYDRSFHNFHPTHGVVLNVEVDHLDLYKSLDEIVEAFAVFARRIAPSGTLLIHHEMPQRLAVTAGLDCDIETIGFAPQADWVIEIAGDTVYLHHEQQCAASWRSPMPGEHMAYNAAAAAVTAHRLGVSWDIVGEAIASFRGLDRRMQQLPDATLPGGGRMCVIDDYGHHPTEIDTTLRALRMHYKPNRLICVFQPHQHSRTRFLMEQFATSFSEADIVIVPDIYFVRDSEAERLTVTAADLVDRLRQRGTTALHMHPLEAIAEQLPAIAADGDLLVTMGAGDVWKVSHALVGRG